MKVLLVDDEKELVSTLAERLSFRDIDVDYAVTADEAMNLAAKKTYDIGVIDVKMPKIRGFELKKMLHEKYPEMAFVFVTGHGSEYDYEIGAADAGKDFYLLKPVQIDVLISRMNEAIKKRGGSK